MNAPTQKDQAGSSVQPSTNTTRESNRPESDRPGTRLSASTWRRSDRPKRRKDPASSGRSGTRHSTATSPRPDGRKRRKDAARPTHTGKRQRSLSKFPSPSSALNSQGSNRDDPIDIDTIEYQPTSSSDSTDTRTQPEPDPKIKEENPRIPTGFPTSKLPELVVPSFFGPEEPPEAILRRIAEAEKFKDACQLRVDKSKLEIRMLQEALKFAQRRVRRSTGKKPSDPDKSTAQVAPSSSNQCTANIALHDAETTENRPPNDIGRSADKMNGQSRFSMAISHIVEPPSEAAEDTCKRPRRGDKRTIRYVPTCFCAESCDAQCLNRQMEQWCTTESCRLTAQACGHRGTTDRQLELEKFDTNELGLGFGLRCKSAIEEGECFLEYTGDVMPLEEASHDQKLYGMRLKASNDLLTAWESKGLARYINHSCVPNCTAQEFSDPSASSVGGSAPRVIIQALRKIAPLEPLTISYGDAYFEQGQCKCGQSECKFQ